MAIDPNQILSWAKTKMFGDWAPEDQEWGIQEFLKDKGWSVEDLATAIQNNRFQEHSDYWFKTKGHSKTAARNADRDQSGGYLPGQAGYSTPEQREKAKLDADASAAQGRTNKINADLDAFYNMLSQPIDPNDPEIQRVSSMAGRSAVGQAYGSGIEGGLSVANTERAAGAAAADMFQRERERRDGLRAQVGGLRASGALSQQDFHQRAGQIAEANRRYQEGLRYDDAMNQYNAGLQQRQMWGGLAGGAVGALGFLGGPAVGAATTAAGSQFGAGAATLGMRPPPRRSYSGGY